MQNKLKMSEMKDLYAGRPAAILGGGPSLPDDLKRVPANALLIAVNYHAFYHLPEDQQPTYMVYNDAPDTNVLQVKAVEEHKAIHVSPDPSTDVEFDVNVWTGFYSSHTALWFAAFLGCAPIIICGHDLYQGPVKHCPPSTYHSTQFDQPLDFHLRPWVEDAKNMLPHPERIRVMSGPLVAVFGAY